MTDFTPRDKYYQAIATLQGTLSLDDPHPVLDVEGLCFPVQASTGVRSKHQPGQVQNFRVYPRLFNRQVGFKLVYILTSPPTPLTLMGCWELHQGLPYFGIYRNEVRKSRDRLDRTLVPVVWADAPPADGQFWQAEAELREGAFVITKAEGPFVPPPKVELSGSGSATMASRPAFTPPIRQLKDAEQAHGAVPSASVAAQIQTIPPIPSLTMKEIRDMAIPAKISLTCKLNQVPPHRELPDQRIEFYLKDGESDRIFTVRMKPKIFKKLSDHGFTDWVAAITGEIGTATETGFELINAAVQVFEKKAKSDGESSSEGKEKAIERAIEQKPVVEANPLEKSKEGKRKSLLDGVQVR
jgi:hypothetical protein